MSEKLDKITDWSQTRVIHCPDPKCKGMLLTSDFCHEYLCSDCKCYWDQIISWVKVK